MGQHAECGQLLRTGTSEKDTLTCVQRGDHYVHRAANGSWWMLDDPRLNPPPAPHHVLQERWAQYEAEKALRMYEPRRYRVKVYFDFRDWWVGYYRGDEHHYVCLLPTLVIRWPRGR